MEKPQGSKLWKQVHHGRKGSDSLDNSFNSNRSSVSSGYNRFQFKRAEEASKKKAIFHFTARDKDNPYDLSHLTQRRKQLTPRVSKQNNESEFAFLEQVLKRLPSIPFDKPTPLPLKAALRELKTLLRSFRAAVDYFSTEMRELQREWDRAITLLATNKCTIEESSVLELRIKLQQKQKQLDRVSRESSLWDKNFTPAASGAMATQSVAEGGIGSLAISKVDDVGGNQPLSRNNTLQSLLGAEIMFKSSINPSGLARKESAPDLLSLRERLQRMKDVLQSPLS